MVVMMRTGYRIVGLGRLAAFKILSIKLVGVDDLVSGGELVHALEQVIEAVHIRLDRRQTLDLPSNLQSKRF